MNDLLDQRDRRLIEAARAEARAIEANLPTSRDREGPADHPAAGAFEGYQVLREIHRGAQGVVYQAIQKSTGRKVALKVMREGPFAGPRDRARFEREVRILGRLRHPNIVAVLDTGEAAGHFYYAMDYISGRPLDRWLVGRRVPVREALQLFASICEAVNAAHLRGIIHRDLKPGNVVIDGEGAPHVLDFGLAKVAGADGSEEDAALMTATGQFLGSLPWASPEQASGTPDLVDTRSDVYALGVMLFQMLTGHFPYDVEHGTQAALANIVTAAPQRPSALDGRLDDEIDTIVLKCLSKERERRYQTAGELARDVRRYLGGEPIEAKRDSGWYVLRKTMGRYRVQSGIAASFLVTGLAAGVTLALLYQTARAGAAAARQDAAQARTEAEAARQELEQVRASLKDPANWMAAFKSAEALRTLGPQEGWVFMHDTWGELTTAHAKQQMLKAVRVSRHPYAHRVFHLGATDADLAVQSWAFQMIAPLALFEPAEEYPRYLKWYGENEQRTVDEILALNMATAAATLRGADEAERRQLLDALKRWNVLRDYPAATKAAAAEGLIDLLCEVFVSPQSPQELASVAGELLFDVPLPEMYLREKVAPLTALQAAGPRGEAIRLLARSGQAWAVDHLLELLVASVVRREGRPEAGPSDIAQALAEIGDARVIPALIGLIDADNTYDTVYGVGYFGLGKLTGVRYDESHDGAWWRAWWEENKTRFPPDVQAIAIPDLKKEDPAPGPAAAGGIMDRCAGGDASMRYFLIPPRGRRDAPPPSGYKLLLVMPGGDGSPDFRPFVENIHAHALPAGYVLAQLVAPRWSPEQFDSIVWPTRVQPWPGARFTSEDFIDAVINEVGGAYPLDERCIFTLSWSSSGPMSYAASLAEGRHITGSFIAMSVFRPEAMPDRAAAAGHAYYLLHSPEDFIPIAHAEAARDELTSHGAVVELQTYQGGHGWHGDVFGMIRAGVQWLEARAREPGSK